MIKANPPARKFASAAAEVTHSPVLEDHTRLAQNRRKSAKSRPARQTHFRRSASTLAAQCIASLAALGIAACSGGSDSAAKSKPSEAASAASSPAATPGEALLANLTTPQQQGKYAPRDDCEDIAGAGAFRQKLADAVLKGDTDAIAAMASPDVKLGFGGDDGAVRFLEKLKEPNSELMQELKALLPLGCAASPDGMLTMPWVFAQDMGDIDGYAATIVTGEDVPLYEKADATSPVKQRISWDVVLLNDGLYPERAFQLVDAGEGVKGYVATAKLRSLLDYRLLAERQGDEWKITAILAGD